MDLHIVGIENFMVFLGAGILLNLYPGPDTLYIVGRSISQGRVAGILAVLGISTGAVFHTMVGAFGFSAFLATSAHAFLLIKYLGAAYLLFQGLKIIFGKGKNQMPTPGSDQPFKYFQVYRQGAITNILNPKVALFFLAFIPQFIAVTSPNKTLSFICLGLVFITTGTTWCLIVAVFSAFISKKLRSNPMISKWLLKINGILYVYLGVRLAMSEASR